MFNWIWNAIIDALLNLLWLIFVQGPLNLISAFNTVLEYLTGGIITDLLFGSSKDFHWNKIPVQFWWFVVIALCIFALIFTIQMIILIFQEAIETKTKFVLAIQNSAKAFAFIFLIPIFFFIANFIVQNLANTIITNFGNNTNIAQYLWHIGNPNWDGTNNNVPSDYGCPKNIREYNMIAQIFGVWFMLFAIFMIGIILVQKIIELFILFIISPIIIIVMVIDNGKAAFTWKDMVIAKFLASTGTLIGYYIFISITQILLSTDLTNLNSEWFAKSLFIILFICGGGIATIGFCDLVGAFVGERTGINEAKSSFKSTINGSVGALSGSSKMLGKTMKFKNKKSTKGISKLSSLNSSKLNTQVKKSKLDFNPFHTATTIASKSGIIGLAGLGFGAFASSTGKLTAKTINTFKLNNIKKQKNNNLNTKSSSRLFNQNPKISKNGIKSNLKITNATKSKNKEKSIKQTS